METGKVLLSQDLLGGPTACALRNAQSRPRKTALTVRVAWLEGRGAAKPEMEQFFFSRAEVSKGHCGLPEGTCAGRLNVCSSVP